MKGIGLFLIVVGMISISACGPATPLAGPAKTEAEAAPMVAAAGEARIPAGWTTHSSQQCEYAISYPPDMEATEQTLYSQTFAVRQAVPEEGARNFLYVSVIAPEIQGRVQDGAYQHEVYNYDPAETESLLKMQVGETKSLQQSVNVQSGFTFQRQPDTMVSGHAAQTYERLQPWEFPAGTKEIRYYVSLSKCTYLIGGYMDTTGSGQPGAITEDLFHQIIGTVQVMP